MAWGSGIGWVRANRPEALVSLDDGGENADGHMAVNVPARCGCGKVGFERSVEAPH